MTYLFNLVLSSLNVSLSFDFVKFYIISLLLFGFLFFLLGFFKSFISR